MQSAIGAQWKGLNVKGIVFTEFLEMVDERFSPAIAEHIIEKSDLDSGGAYTSVGTYDHAEMVSLVSNLSKETEMGIPELLKEFGRYLMGRFVALFPQFFENCATAFDFLETVDQYIHIEVRKLYPDAELPVLECSRPADGQLKIHYTSSRGLGDLAEGLIEAACEHFQEPITIARKNGADGTEVNFLLTLNG